MLTHTHTHGARKASLTLLLALLLVVTTLLVACGGGSGSTTTTTPDTQGGTEGSTDGGTTGTTEAPYVDPEAYLYEDLPTGDFGGETVSILQYRSGGSAFMVDMHTEEDDGTLINGSLWERSMTIEERLKIDLEIEMVTPATEVNVKIEADMASQDCNYQIFSGHSGHLADQVLNGHAVAYEELTNVNLDKPWWNAEMMNYLSLGNGKVYMGYGYANMSVFDAQCAIFFNQNLLEDYNLPSIYDMVDNRTWTMDNFIALCREFAANGENFYGVSCYPYVGAGGLIYGCDVDFFALNAEDQWEFVGLTDRMYDVYTKMGGMLLDETVSNLDSATYVSAFRDESALCVVLNVSQLKHYRDDAVQYGVAPFPLYDENQEEYMSYTTNQAQGVCVSVLCDDLSMISTVLENLAAESYRQLKDVYFEHMLEERLLRDEKSKEVLAAIFETPLVLPVSAIYDFGLASNIFAFDGGDTDIASKVDGCRDMVLYKLSQFYGK